MTNSTLGRLATYFILIIALSNCEGIIDDSELQLPNCNDGVKNQQEENVDCGGPCVSCDEVRENYFRLTAYDPVNVVPADRLVQLLFQVTDFDRNGVPDLGKDDFIITENNNKTTESISTIRPEAIPFIYKTVLLLDVSLSIKDNVEDIKQAAIALINSFTLNQEMAIYVFDSNTRLLVDFTNDKQELIAAIETLTDNNLDNSTNLYNAIIDVSDKWKKSYTIDSIIDGSLIIFTDGNHTAGGSTTISDVRTALGVDRRNSTYFAAVQSEDLTRPEELQQILGENSEDRYFEAANFKELKDQFILIKSRIEDLANSFYFLNYKSPISSPDDVENDLKIEVIGNTNTGSDKEIVEQFNSKGFGN